MNAFDLCARFVLSEAIEGGLSDHPRDPGGRTNRGVTQRRLRRARVDHPHLNLPATVDLLTREHVLALFHADEWTWIHGDELPPAIALLAFDAAVNQGIGDAIGFLQQALNVKWDGKLGPVTLAAARRAVVKELALEYAALRGQDYALLDNLDDVFALGWMRRLFACYTLAITLTPEPPS